MRNLFRFIAALVLALSAADYIISAFPSFIDLIPSLTLPSSYICIFSLLFGCAYNLYFVMSNPVISNMGDHFISKFVEDISSLIMTPIISYVTALINHLLGRPRWNRSQTRDGRMIIARDLDLYHNSYEYDDHRAVWEWIHDYDPRETRFTEVAELLLNSNQLIITGRINFRELHPNTKYGAYLIFSITPDSEGLDSYQEVFFSVGRKNETKYVCLNPTEEIRARNGAVGLPVERSDGWMELELAQFYRGGTGVVMVRLEETDENNNKCGLIVAGIEIRLI